MLLRIMLADYFQVEEESADAKQVFYPHKMRDIGSARGYGDKRPLVS